MEGWDHHLYAVIVPAVLGTGVCRQGCKSGVGRQAWEQAEGGGGEVHATRCSRCCFSKNWRFQIGRLWKTNQFCGWHLWSQLNTYSIHLCNVFDRTFCYVQFPGLLFLKSLLSMLEDSDFVDVVSKRAAKGFIVAPKSELLTRGWIEKDLIRWHSIQAKVMLVRLSQMKAQKSWI